MAETRGGTGSGRLLLRWCASEESTGSPGWSFKSTNRRQTDVREERETDRRGRGTHTHTPVAGTNGRGGAVRPGSAVKKFFTAPTTLLKEALHRASKEEQRRESVLNTSVTMSNILPMGLYLRVAIRWGVNRCSTWQAMCLRHLASKKRRLPPSTSHLQNPQSVSTVLIGRRCLHGVRCSPPRSQCPCWAVRRSLFPLPLPFGGGRRCVRMLMLSPADGVHLARGAILRSAGSGDARTPPLTL